MIQFKIDNSTITLSESSSIYFAGKIALYLGYKKSDPDFNLAAKCIYDNYKVYLEYFAILHLLAIGEI